MSVGGVDAALVDEVALILAQEVDRHGPSTKGHLRSRLTSAKRLVLDLAIARALRLGYLVNVSRPSSTVERYGIGPAAPPRPRRRPTTGAQLRAMQGTADDDVDESTERSTTQHAAEPSA